MARPSVPGGELRKTWPRDGPQRLDQPASEGQTSRLGVVPIEPRDVDELMSYLFDPEATSLPFEVLAAERDQPAAELQSAMDEAIRFADARAEARAPDDPTSSELTTLVDGRLVAEIGEGSLEDAEIRAWFSDVGTRLDELGVAVRIAPRIADDRVPTIDHWMSLPPTPTAFLHFTDPSPGPSGRRIPLHVIEDMAEPLVAWTRLPGGTVVVRKGLVEVAVSSARAAHVFLEGMPIEPPQFGLRRFQVHRRVQRRAQFGYEAGGDLQVLDDNPLSVRLEAVLDGVRIVGPALDYASVRRATPVSPSDFDPPMVLGRPLTRMEELTAGWAVGHLLANYAPDAYVAQVLTDSHLAKARDLSLFTIEPLGEGRHLVRARDVAPWLEELNPDRTMLARARAGFGDMLLTDEVYSAHPPPPKSDPSAAPG